MVDYDPSGASGVRVNIVDGADGLGASIDDLKASIDLLTIAVNALIEAMAP
jgi:hypothetical protein